MCAYKHTHTHTNFFLFQQSLMSRKFDNLSGYLNLTSDSVSRCLGIYVSQCIRFLTDLIEMINISFDSV